MTKQYPESAAPDRRLARRALTLLLVAMVGTVTVLRASLALSPNSDFNVLGYNIHHLFTGVLIVTACAIPLAVGVAAGRLRDALVAGLGVGLGLVLDEWVYLIATDGTNASYLLPVSFWGAVIVVGAAAVYAVVWYVMSRQNRATVSAEGSVHHSP